MPFAYYVLYNIAGPKSHIFSSCGPLPVSLPTAPKATCWQSSSVFESSSVHSTMVMLSKTLILLAAAFAITEAALSESSTTSSGLFSLQRLSNHIPCMEACVAQHGPQCQDVQQMHCKCCDPRYTLSNLHCQSGICSYIASSKPSSLLSCARTSCKTDANPVNLQSVLADLTPDCQYGGHSILYGPIPNVAEEKRGMKRLAGQESGMILSAETPAATDPASLESLRAKLASVSMTPGLGSRAASTGSSKSSKSTETSDDQGGTMLDLEGSASNTKMISVLSLCAVFGFMWFIA